MFVTLGSGDFGVPEESGYVQLFATHEALSAEVPTGGFGP